MFQYLAWITKGSTFWKGNNLLAEAQINNVKAALMGKKPDTEIHETVQRYDANGNVIYTPIYADFDGENASNDVALYVDMIEREFSVEPDIFFSGRKGYHVFINTKIYHTHPHFVVRDFATLLSKEAKTLDMQMYASRHLLRSEGSVHLKSGLFKTRIKKELIGDMTAIKKLASKQSISTPTVHDSKLLNLFLPTLIAKVDLAMRIEAEKYASVVKEIGGEVSPCIKSILNHESVPGSRNATILLMARNMNSIGMEREAAIEYVTSHPHWSALSKEVKATFVSVWKKPSRFGCANQPILREYCDPFCPFNTEVLAVG